MRAFLVALVLIVVAAAGAYYGPAYGVPRLLGRRPPRAPRLFPLTRKEPPMDREEILAEVSRLVGRNITRFGQLHPTEVEAICKAWLEAVQEASA